MNKAEPVEHNVGGLGCFQTEAIPLVSHTEVPLQIAIALSTAESEYVAACYAAQEVVSLRALLDRLGFVQEQPTCVYEDNAACILLAGEPVFRERSKHIDVRWHFVRQMTRQQKLQLVPCSTHDMIADALTKALGRVKHVRFTEMIMNYKLEASRTIPTKSSKDPK